MNKKFTLRDGILYTEGALKSVIKKLNTPNKKIELLDPETNEKVILDDVSKKTLINHFELLLQDL